MSVIRYWLITALVVFLTACSPSPELQMLQGRTMGTTYTVKFVTAEDVETTALQQKIDKALVEVNRQMSTYDPDSDLSRFNALPSDDWVTFDADTMTVLNEAKRLGDLTGGVLDVTVGPLVNLWGFGPEGRPEAVPSDEQLADIQAFIGLDKLIIDNGRVRKGHPDLYVDLSTIAKGFGVDVVADILEQDQISDYLVEIGGEMRLAGMKPDEQPWRVAIEKPVTEQRVVAEIISIGDNALATSGDYRNYFEENGTRYSHIIHPNTGRPIQHNLVSVTVVHPSAMTADGLATAINVMGLERGLAFASEQNLAVFFITKEIDGFKAYNTAEFEPYLQ